MNTPRLGLIAALTVLLVVGCSQERAADDDSPIEVRGHECPDNPLIECAIDGDVAVETYLNDLGTPVRRVTYTYRELPTGNRSVLQEFDNSASGTVDARLTTTYDNRGNPIEALWEPEVGSTRRNASYRYPPPGEPCMEHPLCQATEVDYRLVEYENCLCNEQGDLVARLDGSWNPPAVTRVSGDHMTYVYRELENGGRSVEQTIDFEANDTADIRLTTSYDSAGQPVSAFWEGRPVIEQVEEPAAGSPPTVDELCAHIVPLGFPATQEECVEQMSDGGLAVIEEECGERYHVALTCIMAAHSEDALD